MAILQSRYTPLRHGVKSPQRMLDTYSSAMDRFMNAQRRRKQRIFQKKWWRLKLLVMGDDEVGLEMQILFTYDDNDSAP